MLKGHKVHLRTVRAKDLELLLDLMSDVSVRGNYYPLDLPTESSLRARYDKNGMWSDETGMLLMIEPDSDRIIGLIVFFKAVHYYNGYEIGYIVFDPTLRGKGITPEAVQLLVHYLFAWKPISRLQLQIQPENKPSIRVAKKCGFQFESIARGALLVDGKPSDICVYSLLRDELILPKEQLIS